ncbi:MAG TPA: hypothetical protein VGE01_04245 [Fimbriimonas sp.]
MSRITHIVPATPPTFNGLGDYARMLHLQRADPSCEWQVAALQPGSGAEAAWPGVRFHPFLPDAGSLGRALQEAGSAVVALHYVPHAYHPKGVPDWLPEALEEWKGRTGGRLVVFFHELFAFAPPWRTAFWLAPASIRILRRVGGLSDASLTSNDLYAKQLRVYGGLADAPRVVPVGSNIAVCGRSEGYRSAEPARIAVFGSAETRRLALKTHAKLIRRFDEEGLLGRLVLIGSSGRNEEPIPARLCDKVERVADASNREASCALASCGLALIATEQRRVAKSGVFAAACAHGLLPIVPSPGSDQGPYLAVDPGRPAAALAALRDGDEVEAIHARVREHARRSAWPAIVEAWSQTIDSARDQSSP